MTDDAKRRRRVWPWVAGGLAAAAVAVVAAFAWDASQILRSKDELTAHAAGAKEALGAADATALATEVAALEGAARDFASATSGPHWWLAAHTPWVADQAVPLMRAGQAVDAIAADALAPIAELGNLEALEVPELAGGRLDPYALEPYRDALAQAAAALDAQVASLAQVDLDGTLDQVSAPFLELEEQVGEVASLVQGGHVAAELLPGMMGGEGERHYLVMVQNNAEPRATGGIPGAVIEVAVQDGRLTMGQYSSATSMAQADGVGGLTEDEERIFSRRMEVYPHDVNFTPEFPSSAALMTRYWEAEHGQRVDGVLSLDPVALGWILEGAPATEVDGFTITGENLAQVMLNESYLTFEDPAEQDAFFTRASAALFQRIVSGEASALSGIERAIETGRFLLWSANEAEQDLLATTAVAGAFLEDADALGIFLNDGSGSKVGWYIENQTAVTDLMCPDGRLAGQDVEVTFTHTYSGDPGDLPEYISGGWLVPAGEFHANLLLYPAEGTAVTAFERDGEPASLNPELHAGRSITSARVVLAPGESVTLRYHLTAEQGASLPPSVVETPGPQPRNYTRDRTVLTDGC